MKPLASPHFQAIDLSVAQNADRTALAGGLGQGPGASADWSLSAFGRHILRGIPFLLGEPRRANVIHLAAGGPAIRVPLRVPAVTAGRSETRHYSGRVDLEENLWLYALANPRPETAITGLVLRGRTEDSLVYGVAATRLADHPLRPGVRRRLLVALPPARASMRSARSILTRATRTSRSISAR